MTDCHASSLEGPFSQQKKERKKKSLEGPESSVEVGST
jgi:hypothetical protein